MKAFIISRDKYSEEIDLFIKHENEIKNYCETHINGNWMLNLVLWGETEETAKPTILLVYEGPDAKADDWKDPEIKGLPFMSEVVVFRNGWNEI